MSKISYFKCDRCGRIEKLDPLLIIPHVSFFKSKRLKLVFNRFPDEEKFGFELDKEVELCEECMTSCYKWFKTGKTGNGGAGDEVP